MTIIDLRIGFIIVKLSWEFPHFRGFETGSKSSSLNKVSL
ncbi:hypothetical protein LEP1GSC103_1000 [Leptospira borgpetersenii serovar Javanica str. UI 09931]|uniref:Uncharacterized protein n=3 Tax=Leptospira borgpetersenii TaxID=174 RepID=A0A0S2IU07_LEPBO|nr:hypothetical protein LBBP_00401 [Leptospira borgpetersenii serovar Ballum]EKP11896.1 hypothetical protein LEP1GSC128_4047 [Leptospira borgpetersenii str. 200801926]EKQ93617.1 hypothetical protein LEP1GSC101_0031 [Leptospira borgpetersenii str. UI 09149]EKQ98196.1 hypothetical protein LEP1GSC121_0704 [Leptospira borgpetersenii serovar Castellonis str. 200801910]EMK11139.1 hypothetical protein LEP1GSC066_2207 [Leptospira sp. serovar Kenya str. Sh9]EMN56396.1 hypothetical protein LEP1GSC090_18